MHADGIVNEHATASTYAEYFNRIYSSNDPCQATKLNSEYDIKRLDYSGISLSERCLLCVKLVSKVISNMSRDKAAGPDRLHLIHSHPVIPYIQCRLFNLMLQCGHVP